MKAGSAFDAAAAARDELTLELHHSAKTPQAVGVDVPIALAEHPNAVDHGCDGRSNSTPEVLARGTHAQVVVAARPPRCRDNCELAGPGPSDASSIAGELIWLDRVAILAGRVELVQRTGEPA